MVASNRCDAVMITLLDYENDKNIMYFVWFVAVKKKYYWHRESFSPSNFGELGGRITSGVSSSRTNRTNGDSGVVFFTNNWSKNLFIWTSCGPRVKNRCVNELMCSLSKHFVIWFYERIACERLKCFIVEAIRFSFLNYSRESVVR